MPAMYKNQPVFAVLKDPSDLNIENKGPLDPQEVYERTRPADWITVPDPAENEIYFLVHCPVGATCLFAFEITCSNMTNSHYYVTQYNMNYTLNPYNTYITSCGTKFQWECGASSNSYPVTSDGFRQYLFKVHTTNEGTNTAGNILSWKLSTHNKKTSPSNFTSWNIVEIKCNLPYATNIGVSKCSMLRYFTCTANSITDMSYMFSSCISLITIPQLDTSQVTSMSHMLRTCPSLITIPKLDTSKVTSMNYMFNGCSSLTTIPQLDTSQVTSMGYMLSNCPSLITIPQLDTSQVTSMNYMFSGCYSLITIPQLDTSKVTSMTSMFNECYSLTAIPQLDTSKVTSMDHMFSGCYSLITIPQLDTSKVTSMNYMFGFCYSLTTIPQLDTSKVTNMGYMLSTCPSLITIPQLDTSKVTSMTFMFNMCRNLALCLFNPDVSNWGGCDISFNTCSMGHQALVAMFNSLPTPIATRTLTITGNPGVSDLTDEEKAIATNKNWTLVTE